MIFGFKCKSTVKLSEELSCQMVLRPAALHAKQYNGTTFGVQIHLSIQMVSLTKSDTQTNKLTQGG